MECIENIVKDIYECCKIPFQVSIESLGAYETSEYDDSDQIISKNIKFNYTYSFNVFSILCYWFINIFNTNI